MVSIMGLKEYSSIQIILVENSLSTVLIINTERSTGVEWAYPYPFPMCTH